MKRDIILSGVGGQGILSIATVIGAAALKEGLHIKQAEVHGMSQRGGDVQSNLRISSDEILSDLIPQGAADIIISLEPMEALRYVPYLNPEDRVLIIDDFLANGAALEGLMDLVQQAGATVVGAGIAVEKAFQPGGERIRAKGVRVESLARVKEMHEGEIVFC